MEMLAVESNFPYRDLTTIKASRVVVVAPHPDDETLGCGGSLVKHIKAGAAVKVVILTDGRKGDPLGRYKSLAKYIELRETEAKKACKVLGVSDVEFWRFGDQELVCHKAEVLTRLVKLFESFQPELIYAPSANEDHSDHQVANELVWGATNESLSVRYVVQYEISPPAIVNCYIDITNQWRKKRRALRVYKSQTSLCSYGDGMLGLNQYRATNCPPAVRYVEAFNIAYRTQKVS